MKKLISVILSISVCLSVVTAAKAAVTEINDGLEDTSKMLSYSGNLIFEQKDKLGSYQNPVYATSDAGVMEMVYELANMSGFEVTTLNYRETENISFYVSDNADSGYEELSGYTEEKENLGSSWERISYQGSEISGRFFKIVINQENGKYIRLDNVKLFTKYELQLESFEFKRSGEEISDGNIYEADSLTLRFNQGVSSIPELLIQSADNGEIKAEGKKGIQDNEVVYEFDKLGFGIYSFSAKGFETITKEVFDFEVSEGYQAVFAMGDVIHFEDEYTVSGCIKKAVNASGKELTAEVVSAVSADEEVIDVRGDKFELKKAGETVIDIVFTVNGLEIQTEKKVTLCGAREIVVSPSSVKLNKGGSSELSVKLRLTDDTEIAPEKLEISSVDDTIAKVSGNTVTGVSSGTTFINITADYYGEVLRTAVPVGVDTEPVKCISRAELAVNRTDIVIGEKIAAAVNGFYEDGTAADMLASQRKMYSDNPGIAKVTADGYIEAVSEGNVNIYAEISLGGISVVSGKLTITVSKDEPARAELLLPGFYMLKGETMTAAAAVYTKTGKKIDASITYISEGGNLSISENEITAVNAGKATVYAAAEYEGKRIESNKVTVEISENNGMNAVDFLSGTVIDDTYEHSDNWYIETGVGLFSTAESGVPQYFLLKNEDEIRELSLTCYYHTSIQKGEVKIEVSKDGNDYLEIPENDISAKNNLDVGVWYYKEMNYSGALLEGAHYVRVTLKVDITLDSNRAQSVQCIRIHNVKMKCDKPAEIAGISLLNSSGKRAYGTDARKIVVHFSQEPDKESLAQIKLTRKSSGESTASEGVYENGKYIMNIPKLENDEYVLNISGVKNKFGTASQPYEYTISPAEEGSLSVSDITIDGGRVSAEITNSGSDITASIIAAVYDADGYITGIYVDNGVNITEGKNSFKSGGTFAAGSSVKIFIWNNMRDIHVY